MILFIIMKKLLYTHYDLIVLNSMLLKQNHIIMKYYLHILSVLIIYNEKLCKKYQTPTLSTNSLRNKRL